MEAVNIQAWGAVRKLFGGMSAAIFDSLVDKEAGNKWWKTGGFSRLCELNRFYYFSLNFNKAVPCWDSEIKLCDIGPLP